MGLSIGAKEEKIVGVRAAMRAKHSAQRQPRKLKGNGYMSKFKTDARYALDSKIKKLMLEREKRIQEQYAAMLEARRKAMSYQVQSRKIVKARVMKNDTVIKRQWVNRIGRPFVGGGVRKPIRELTRRSLRAMKLHFRNIEGAKYIVTLTYPANFPMDGKLVKYHLMLIRKWFLYYGVSGSWFLEFQVRGAPHFHIITNKAVDKEALSRQWYKVVGSGDEKHLKAGTQQQAIRKPHAVAAYVAKYAAKSEQKIVPAEYANVGRFWGGWGDYYRVKSEVKDGLTGGEFGTDSNGYALVKVLRSAKKLVKSRGYAVRDKGVYGFTLWGVGAVVMSQLAQFYGHVQVLT